MTINTFRALAIFILAGRLEGTPPLTVAPDPDGNTSTLTAMAISLDNKTLVSAYGVFRGLLQRPAAGQAIVWDIATGKKVHTFVDHSDGVSAVAFSPDCRIVITASFDGTAKVRELATGKTTRTINVRAPVSALAVSSDGKILAVATVRRRNSKAMIRMYSLVTGAHLRDLVGHNDDVVSLLISADSKVIVSAGLDYTIRTWDIRKGTEINSTKSDLLVLDMSFCDNGRTIVVGGRKNTRALKKGELRRYRVGTLKLINQSLPIRASITSLVVSKSGKWALAISNECIVYDVAELRQVKVLQFKGEDVAVSPDGSRIAMANGTKIGVLFAKSVFPGGGR